MINLVKKNCCHTVKFRLRSFRILTTVCGLLLLGFISTIPVGCRILNRRTEEADQLAACRTLSQQGMAAIEAQHWAKAEKLMSKALLACPHDIDARRYYAEALWHRGRRAEAIMQLRAVAEECSGDADIHVRLGEMLLAEGHLTSALDQAEVALDLAPDVAATWKFRARVLLRKGHLQNALADYHRALSHCNDDRDVLFEIADVYRHLGKPQEALAMLNSLVDTYPLGEEPKEVIRMQGLAMTALGRFSQAAERYGKLVTLGGATADDFISLADAQWRAGSGDMAVLSARRALEINPANIRGQELMARLQNPDLPAGTLRR